VIEHRRKRRHERRHERRVRESEATGSTET
jgi:hypothetical protein